MKAGKFAQARNQPGMVLPPMAFPIFWTLLDKQGASNLAEQQQVYYVRLFGLFKKI
jgi:hypothetical protein